MDSRHASGVHHLALLLLDLDSSEETSRILCADALYQKGRGDKAHKILLVALSKPSQRPAALVRLAFLQLRKGFLYDCNQLLKKITQSGATSYFLDIVKILKDEDRTLMQRHCHSRAMSILRSKQVDGYLRDAVVYLSLAIIVAGGYAVNSLLIWAYCYGQLGQKKTAIFYFNTILKEDPTNAQALCGKGFVYPSLNQEKVAAKEGNALVQQLCDAKAIGYYSLAVMASNNDRQYLRLRSTCLAHLIDYHKALKDMDPVIQNHECDGLRAQVEDYCSQGHMFLSISEEESAVKQYIKAFQLEESLALANISPGPNRDMLSKDMSCYNVLLQSYLVTRHYEDAWKATEYGLVVYPNNHDLNKLKLRIKREVSGCRVQ